MRVFPPQSGPTYSTWLYIDKLASNAKSLHPIRLLTLVKHSKLKDTLSSCLCIQLSAKNRSLFVNTDECLLHQLNHDEKLSDSSVKFNCSERFQEGQLLHLCIVMSRAVLKTSTLWRAGRRARPHRRPGHRLCGRAGVSADASEQERGKLGRRRLFAGTGRHGNRSRVHVRRRQVSRLCSQVKRPHTQRNGANARPLAVVHVVHVVQAKKSAHLNLTFSLAVCDDNGKQVSGVYNAKAFECLVCDLDIWYECSAEINRCLHEKINELLLSDWHNVQTPNNQNTHYRMCALGRSGDLWTLCRRHARTADLSRDRTERASARHC
ncbi:WD repeat and FYVE domain-containing 3-like isoform X1 [Brachionus plicatilis]|uniref:WD repeat and FYVE domain-containing 3-like isoform X1 n=1 Tax=Brachionus plicatilis TaxID=10195 RepID=A0A3M7P3T9_BRAPC|nr:WD repeat and FYVE domain-containing 3-like isoform X1 [Brachionus plicatilis]